MKKHLLSFLMFFSLIVSAFAQPSSPATTPPARSASDVLSLFSGAYSNYPGTNWNPNWGQATQVADVYVSGDTIKRYTNLNYQGVDIFGAINVSSMQYLHLDIWTSDCDTMMLSLINEGIGEQAYTIYPTINGWKSVDIALSNYNLVALNNVGQLKIEGDNGSTLYLDNIYFWKSANAPSLSNFTVPAKTLGDAPFSLTAPTSNSSGSFSYTSSNTNVATVSGSTVTIVGVGVTTITATQAAAGAYSSGSIGATLTVELGTAAPTPPVRSASNVISLFSNAYTNVTVDTWSAGWDGANVDDVTIAGNATKKYDFYGGFAGIEFTSATVNATNMEKFHIDIYTPNATVFKVKLVDFGPNGTYGGGDDAEHELGYVPTQNSWVSYDINLSDFTGLVTRGHLAQMIFVAEGSNPIVYIDNIYFWRATPAPTLGAFTVPAKSVGDASFSLTAPTSNSSGSFSYTSSNPNVATISGSTVTIIGAGTSVITATQAAAGAYGVGSTTANLVVSGPAVPAVAAPTPPARVSSDVVSLFSGAYTNVSGINWFPWWWQNAMVEDTTIAGDAAHKYPNLNYHGVEMPGVVDASGMTKLHFDIWTPDCETFDFYFINTHAGTVERKISVTPPFRGWQSYDINLTEFSTQGIDLSRIAQFKFVSYPFGGTTVYMDNIYFWKPAGAPAYGSFTIPSKTVGDAKFKITPPSSSNPAPFTYTSSDTSVAKISNDSIIVRGAGTCNITASQAAGGGFLAGSISASFTVNYAPPSNAAPIPPTRSSGDFISLFSNAYTNVPVETWSASWDMADVTDIKIGGNDTKKYTNMIFSGTNFTTSQIDASNMTTFHIDMWTPDATSYKVKLVDFGSDGAYGGGDDSESELTMPTPAKNTWISYDIPLANFVGLNARAHLAQLIMVSSNSTLYLDNIYFWKGTAKSPSISVTQPTCTVTTGTITVQGSIPAGMTFSKDNGATFTNSTGIFTGLVANTYKIRSKTALGVISDSVVAVILTTTPTAPGTITGSINVSQCDTNQIYSVSPVDGYTYLWAVTGTGNYVKAGQGTNSAILVMKASGSVSCKAAKCGATYGAASTLAVLATQPAKPATMTSTGTNVMLFTQKNVAVTGVKDTFRIKRVTGMTGYYFEVPGGSTMDRVNDTTIAVVFPDTITLSTTSPRYVKVYNLSLCDTSLALAVTLTRVVPAAPTVMTATGLNVCQFTQSMSALNGVKDTVRIRRTTGMTGYHFEVPGGSTMVRLNDTTITVVFPDTIKVSATSPRYIKAYNIRVRDTSVAKVLTLTRLVPATPAAIFQADGVTAAASNVCTSVGSSPVIYKIRKVTNAFSYNWSMKFGTKATITHINPLGVNDTAVSVTYASGFTTDSLFVAANSCQASVAKKLMVSAVMVPPTPTAITGRTFSLCHNQDTVLYRVTGGTVLSTTGVPARFSWTVPAFSSIIYANADSSQVRLRTQIGYRGGTLSVKAVTACNIGSAVKTQALTIPTTPVPPTTANITGPANGCIGSTASYTAVTGTSATLLGVYNNFRWALPANTSIVSSNSDSSTITISFNTGYIGGALKAAEQTACGVMGATFTKTLTHVGCPSGTSAGGPVSKVQSAYSGSVYPNPNNGTFTINLVTPESVTGNAFIEVFDAYGKRVAKYNAISSFGRIRTEIKNSTLANGIYTVTCTLGKTSQSFKMVIKK